MLFWLNPLKWWRIFQIKRRWKRSNLQFISAYHQQDWAAAESAARLMAAGAGLRSILLDSYYSLMLCYRGMGEVKNSEGVFGLRRALAIAGAKYVITSLWNIPTKPSALLMEEFFRLYQSSIHPAAALTAAQKYVRNITLGDLNQSQLGQEVIIELQKDYIRQIPVNAPDDFQPLAHPYFWGAWICQG